jgi:hypothetical protein
MSILVFRQFVSQCLGSHRLSVFGLSLLLVVVLGSACREAPPSDPPLSSESRVTGSETSDESVTSLLPSAFAAFQTQYHSRCCDGSAGVALDDQYFLVANDENNVLRVYERKGRQEPVTQVDFRKFLDLKKKDQESDIEGMALIDSTVYVIASHSRSKDGDKEKGRRQLFAVQFDLTGDQPNLHPLGEPYTKLHKRLEELHSIPGLDWERAGDLDGDDLGALNIEGLSSTPDGELMIGFRTPVHRDKAILLPVRNPMEVIQGLEPIFGAPILLNLGGTGIRGLEQFAGTYLIATESDTGKTYPQLFSWDGQSPHARRLFVALPQNFNPESVLLFPDTGLSEIHVLSDDSNRDIGSASCSEVEDIERRRFRRIILRARQ